MMVSRKALNGKIEFKAKNEIIFNISYSYWSNSVQSE